MTSSGDLKVVFIDGLPGTGKTFLSHWLSNRLRDHGVDVHIISEYDASHPLHWFEYLNDDEILPPDFTSIPLSSHIQNSIACWEQFILGLDRNSELQLIDGYPLLNSVGVFCWGELKVKERDSYLSSIRGYLECNFIKTIYLETVDVRLALERKLEHLKKENELEGFMRRMSSMPYAKHRVPFGVDAILELWTDINDIFVEFYKDMPLDNCLTLRRDEHPQGEIQLKSEDFLGY
jgi:hypothetical protein